MSMRAWSQSLVGYVVTVCFEEVLAVAQFFHACIGGVGAHFRTMRVHVP